MIRTSHDNRFLTFGDILSRSKVITIFVNAFLEWVASQNYTKIVITLHIDKILSKFKNCPIDTTSMRKYFNFLFIEKHFYALREIFRTKFQPYTSRYKNCLQIYRAQLKNS